MEKNRCIPPSAVIPEVAYPDPGEGARWLAEAFGFEVRIRIANHRIQMMFGRNGLVVTERRGDDTRRSSIMLRVDDADAACARAVKAGGKLVRAPESHPYGERQGHIEDFAGNQWTLSQTVGDADPVGFGFETGPAFEA
jgi:uncharacterized glyoxalase superfamily protein PhnB